MEYKSSIKLINLKKHFSNTPQSLVSVLNGVTVSFNQGESYAITGVSGSGKSTLLFLIAGLDSPSSGSIIFDDVVIGEGVDFFKSKLGLVFQKPHLIKELTIIENVMLKNFSSKQPSDKTQAISLLKKVGLFERANHYPAELSGGQQQRVALARALYGNPSFLIADEPTAHLDLESKKIVLDLMIQLCVQHNMGLILSTHDQSVAQKMNVVFNLFDGALMKKNQS